MSKRGSKGMRLIRCFAAALSAVAFVAVAVSAVAATLQPNRTCNTASNGVKRLICAEPALAELDAATARAFREYQDRAVRPAERNARLAEHQSWLAKREAACPAAASPRPGAPSRGALRDVALDCLTRVYEQRLAVLRHERNRMEWPELQFRPRLVEGAGTKLCRELERDLLASFFGPAPALNPLGESEIGFIPMPALGGDPMVLRADIDLYNRGELVPVLLWMTDKDAEYRIYGSPAQLLAAIGRGGEPLMYSVREAGHQVLNAVRGAEGMPRFFRHAGRIHLLAPLQRGAGKPGDLGVYRLQAPGQARRLCLFDAGLKKGYSADGALSRPEVKALQEAAGPLLPTGRFCPAAEDDRMLLNQAGWRPWVLARPTQPGAVSSELLARYMQNRGLTGPESARQYRAYMAAREAAAEALSPYYRSRFGRNPLQAKSLAALFVDRLVSDGFQVDPDDESVAALFLADYAERHSVQRAALAGDTAGLLATLGTEPKAVAKGVTGDLDEPLVSDALEHTEALRMLLGMGLDPGAIGASGRTPLMVAARLDLVAAADVLLAQGAAVDKGASEAVAQTNGAGDAECISGKIPAGDTPGRTALSYAAQFGSPAMVRLLLAHGASAAKTDSAGRRPADYVKSRTGDPRQSAEIAELLGIT